MARVPYEGVPEEQPETRVPEDYLQAAAPPQAFGEQVGQALQGAGEKLMSTAQFYEEAAADQATNNFLDGRTKLLYGDASKPQMDERGQPMLGPDGHPIGDGGYLGLRGQAAMDARGDVDQKLNDLIAEQRSSLHTRRSQLEFDNQSRRYRAQALEQIGSHYDQQQKVWNKSVNDNTVELMANQVGIDAADPAAVQRHIDDASVAATKNAQIDGVDPAGAILTVKRRLYTAQIEALGPIDPRAALQAVKDHADVLAGAPNYRALVDQTRTGAKRWLIGHFSDPDQVPAFGPGGVGVEGAPGTPSGAPAVAPSHEAELDAPDKTRAATSAKVFQSNGWSAAQAAGITANLYGESGISPHPRGSNDGGAAYGLAQWHADRQADFAKWAGHPIRNSTLQEQEAFVNYELTQGKFKAVGDRLRNAKTAEEAAEIVMKGFEVPKDQSAQAVANRQAVARQIAGGTFAPAAVQAEVTLPKQGLVTPGNIDLANRPVVQNADGTISTVRSITIEEDGKAILIPTVVGGQVVPNNDAIAHYRATGENLGKFDTEAHADAYAKALHEQQAAQYAKRSGVGKGAPAAGTTEDQYLAQVRAEAKSMLGDAQPDDVEEVVKGVETNIGVKQASEDAAFKQRVKDETAYAEDPTTDLTKLQLSPDSIRAGMPGPEGEQAATLYQHAIDFHKAANRIATASETDVAKILQGHIPSGPEGFIVSSDELQALQKAAQYRDEWIYGKGDKPGDPAAYASNYFPQVQAAWAATIGPQAKPADFTAYMHTLTGVYDRLGVPEAKRNILPRAFAGDVVRQTAAAPDKMLEKLGALQKESGAYWPQVFRDLRQNGLSGEMATPLIIASGNTPQDAPLMAKALAWNAARRAEGKDDVDKEAEETVTKNGKSLARVVDEAIGKNADLSSLRLSLSLGSGATEEFTSTLRSVRSLALYLYLHGDEQDAGQAATRAAKTVTGMYDFPSQGNHPPVRVDKGFADDFRAVASAVTQSLTVDQVRPLPDDPRHPMAEALRRELAFQHATANSYWSTRVGPNGSPAIVLIDAATQFPVVKADGSTFQYYVANLPSLARQVRAQPRLPAADAFVGAMGRVAGATFGALR